MNHLSLNQIRIYLSDELSLEDRLDIETHIAECLHCARRVHALYSARINFEELWDSWTLSSHAAEFQTLRISETIKNTSIRDSLRSRVKHWSWNIQNGVEIALGLTVDASKGLAEIIQDGLDFLGPEIDAGSFTPQPSPVTIQGDVDSSHLIAVETGGPPWTRVTTDPALRRVVVQLQGSQKPWPLIALVARDGSWAEVDAFRDVEGESFLLAEFDDIPSGDFLLIIEKNPTSNYRNL